MMDGNTNAVKYFSSINPIAGKIQLDIDEIKQSYEHLWNELSLNEQIDIINETIIKPEISLRYFDNFSSSSSSISEDTDENLPSTKVIKNIYNFDGKHLSTFTTMKTARKICHDDQIGVFRDEHSAPFNFKTKSQIELNIFPVENDNTKKQTVKHNISMLKSNLQKTASPSAISCTSSSGNSKSKTNMKYNKMVNDDDDDEHDGGSGGGGGGTGSIGGDNLLDACVDDTSINIKIVTPSPKNKENFFSKLKSNVFHSDDSNREAITNIINMNDKEQEEENLVSNTSFGMHSSSSVEEDDEKNFEEFKSLLEKTDIRKDYDFLANW